MPRPSLGARLWLNPETRVWYIREGERRYSTRCPETDRAGAQAALAAHLSESSRPEFGSRDPDRVKVVDVLWLYARERAPLTRRPDIIGSAAPHLGDFWKGKKVGQITPRTCREYVEWRTAQPQARFKDRKTAPRVGDQTARRELEVLSAAIGYAVKERILNYAVPVALPQKAEARERYFTRSEVARLLWAAWRADQGRSRHLCRFILLAVYSGTRHDAILKLRWGVNSEGGWVDLGSGVIYRRGVGQLESSKRRTPVPISDRLMPHLRRWRRSSSVHLVEYAGGPVLRMKRAWTTAREKAGLGEDVVPHVLRHTFATWAVQSGQPFGLVAGALGTTEQVVEQVYGHHAPEHLRGVVNAVGKRR